MNDNQWKRRDFIATTMAMGIVPASAFGASNIMKKKIPGTDETLPAIGLGTYDVFDVASTPEEIEIRKEIVNLLVEKSGGSALLDTSPMYNRSEKVIGDVVTAGVPRNQLFLATKVWINGQAAGRRQMEESADLMRADVIDLMQVHNLRDTKVHMETIREAQDADWIRYSGLTHYTAGAQDALGREMTEYKPDFIQINYSLGERTAEERLLPMAQDQGVGVLINRPFQGGRLFRAVSGKVLPGWATEFADSWGQFFLKFIISHPAVTSAIPATSKPHHMVDNVGAGSGPLPDAATRKRMSDFFASL